MEIIRKSTEENFTEGIFATTQLADPNFSELETQLIDKAIFLAGERVEETDSKKNIPIPRKEKNFMLWNNT